MTNNRERNWDQEFRIIEAHANGTKEKISKEEITEENRGFDNPPAYPSK